MAGGVWVKDAQIYVEGDSDALPDRETWKTVAVLEVHPLGVAFRIGWRTEEFSAAEFYSVPAETERGRLGMMVGDKAVWFVARALDGRTLLTLVCVERVVTSDPRFVSLPLY